MNVLGLFAFGMNPGACYLRDGELVAFGEEERFTRLKGSHGMFPSGAVRFCLDRAGVELDEVDRIAFAWDASRYPYQMFASLAKQYLRYRGRAGRSKKGGDANLHAVLLNLLKFTPRRLNEEIRLALRALGARGEIPEIEFVPHHLCHAYSAYYLSPFREAIVLTVDGSGEEKCSQVAVGRGDELRVDQSIPLPHSLGWYYAAFTAYLGFQPYRNEGKLMALAGLGHGRAPENPWPERLEKVLAVEDGGYRVDPTFTRFGDHSYAERFTDALADWITGFDAKLRPISPAEVRRNGGAGPSRCLDPDYVDLAWGVQHQLEEAAGALAERAARRSGIRNLCIAGGVGLNCKMNGSLLARGSFDRVFAFTACNDAGASIGAAMVVARDGGDVVRGELGGVCLGPEFSSAEIRAALEFGKLRFEECPEIEPRVAGELAAGKLVGWFQGRMEAGPRALGGRSILADPNLPGIADRLNREVKSREPWRPFCPSVLDSAAGRFFERSEDAGFMTIALPVLEEARSAMAATTHVDGSARPQIVTRESNARYHRLLEEFEARTGTPFLVNTSFNVSGEPIVCTPTDAIRTFYASGLDVLAIGDFLLTRK